MRIRPNGFRVGRRRRRRETRRLYYMVLGEGLFGSLYLVSVGGVDGGLLRIRFGPPAESRSGQLATETPNGDDEPTYKVCT